MANTDYVVSLSIDGKEYTATLKKANSEMKHFKKECESGGGALKTLGNAMAKWGPAVSAAGVAYAAFNRAVTDNQSIVDAWGRTITAASSAFGGFMNALQTGDFSNYFSNINKLVETAYEAYNALDRLSTVNIFSSGEISDIDVQLQKYRAVAFSRTATQAQKDEAAKMIEQLLAQRSASIGEIASANRNAAAAEMKRMLAEKGYTGELRPEYYTGLAGYDKAVAMAEKVRALRNKKSIYETAVNSPAMPQAARDKAISEYKAMEEEMKNVDQELYKFAYALSEISDTQLQAWRTLLNNANAAESQQYSTQTSMFRPMNRLTGASGGRAKGPQASQLGYYAEQEISDYIEGAIATLDQAIFDQVFQEFSDAEAQFDELFAREMAKFNASKKQVEFNRAYDTKVMEGMGGVGMDKDAANDYATAVNNIGTAFNNLTSAMQGISEGGDAVIGIMKSIVSSITTCISAYASMAAAATSAAVAGEAAAAPPFAKAAFAMTLLGSLLGVIATVKSSVGKFANGGIVGGTSYSGDKLSASVNAGEMILNRHQQANLLDLANRGTGRGGAAEAYVRGDTIYMSLQNYMHRTGKTLN